MRIGDEFMDGVIAKAMLNGQLRDAVEEGDIMGAYQLLSAGAEVNPQFEDDMGGVRPVEPLLHVAALADNAEMVGVLAGADQDRVDIKNMDGQTALHVSCLEGSEHASHRLLQMGLSPSEKDNHGFTPLDLALARGHSAIVQQIKAAYTDIEMPEDMESLRKSVNEAYPRHGSHVAKLRQRQKPEHGGIIY